MAKKSTPSDHAKFTKVADAASKKFEEAMISLKLLQSLANDVLSPSDLDLLRGIQSSTSTNFNRLKNWANLKYEKQSRLGDVAPIFRDLLRDADYMSGMTVSELQSYAKKLSSAKGKLPKNAQSVLTRLISLLNKTAKDLITMDKEINSLEFQSEGPDDEEELNNLRDERDTYTMDVGNNIELLVKQLQKLIV